MFLLYKDLYAKQPENISVIEPTHQADINYTAEQVILDW